MDKNHGKKPEKPAAKLKTALTEKGEGMDNEIKKIALDFLIFKDDHGRCVRIGPETGRLAREGRVSGAAAPVAAVDLFCGAGGLSCGLLRAGIRIAAGVDSNPACAYPFGENNKAAFILGDAEGLGPGFVSSLYPKRCIRVLAGCVPCQPFSPYSGRHRKNGGTDERRNLLSVFARHVRETMPEIVVSENVDGLTKEGVFLNFVEGLLSLGYSVHAVSADCRNYGVPQTRRRLILLASRIGDIRFAEPTHEGTDVPTVRQAIGHLPAIRDGEASADDPLHVAAKLSELNLMRIKSSKPGGTWRDWNEDLRLSCHGKKSGKSYLSVYGRMSWDTPAPTVTTQFYGYGNGRFGHPEQDRALSLREGALLQSFPENYAFAREGEKVKMREIATLIGNAVPVKLAEAIGKSVMNHLRETGRI
jgi:DNA (cytosine-5)-methyltransferase 1